MVKNSNIVLFPKTRRRKKELTNCQYCSSLLTIDNWSPSNQKYRRYVCKLCWNKRQNKYTENSKSRDPNFEEKKKERTKKWIQSFDENRKILESRKRYNRWLKKAYQISIEDYDKKLLSQSNKCAICKNNKPDNISYFNVDHCHKTGKIRGLLCPSCNFLLGNCKDDIELLEKAKNYLLFYEKEGGKKF